LIDRAILNGCVVFIYRTALHQILFRLRKRGLFHRRLLLHGAVPFRRRLLKGIAIVGGFFKSKPKGRRSRCGILFAMRHFCGEEYEQAGHDHKKRYCAANDPFFPSKHLYYLRHP
jgi:hypothetical protein